MMYDILAYFSDAQAPTTGTTASTNVIDTGTTNRRIGDGQPLVVETICTTTATSGGSNTTQVVLQDSADNSSFSTIVSGPAVAVASIVQGFRFVKLQVPQGARRYLRVAYVIATADLTAGNFTSFLTVDGQQENYAQPSGFSIAS